MPVWAVLFFIYFNDRSLTWTKISPLILAIINSIARRTHPTAIGLYQAIDKGHAFPLAILSSKHIHAKQIVKMAKLYVDHISQPSRACLVFTRWGLINLTFEE